MNKKFECLFSQFNDVKDCVVLNTTGHVYCENCNKVPDLSKIIAPHTDESEHNLDYLYGLALAQSRINILKKGEDGEKYAVKPYNLPQWLKHPEELTCMDHQYCKIEYVDDKKIKVFVSEPYNCSMGDIESLINYCKKYNLYFYIDGRSTHFPGRCIRITISQKRSEE